MKALTGFFVWLAKGLMFHSDAEVMTATLKPEQAANDE